jgi:hypothetical protein
MLMFMQVAVKVVYLGNDTDEDGNMPRIKGHPLEGEVRIYKRLHAVQDWTHEKLEGIPTVRSYSKHMFAKMFVCINWL